LFLVTNFDLYSILQNSSTYLRIQNVVILYPETINNKVGFFLSRFYISQHHTALNLKFPWLCLTPNKEGNSFKQLNFSVNTYIFILISHLITLSGISLSIYIFLNIDCIVLKFCYLLAHLLSFNTFLFLSMSNHGIHWSVLYVWYWNAINNSCPPRLVCPWSAPAVFRNDLSDLDLQQPIEIIVVFITEENCMKAVSSLLGSNS
jgi:hypothetical protein